MLKALLYLSFLIIIGAASCETNTPKYHIRSVIQDTAKFSANSKIELFEAITYITKEINLPSIKKGVDSFEYRLWLTINTDDLNLIRINNVKNKWNISETIVWTHLPDHNFKNKDTINFLLQTIIDSSKTRTLNPDIPMALFIDSLQYFNLQQAPKNVEIEKSYYGATDSWRYTFEIADKNNYRIIEFPCAGEAHNYQTFHQKVKEMLLFLERRLKINFKTCN